nr:DUF11 domain-containing protein [Acidobacteriota bacterium]
YLTFSQGGQLKMRLPVYSAARPASAMSAASPIATGGSPTGSTTVALSGTGVCSGTLSGSTCTGSFPTNEVSLVSPFELQVVHPQNPSLPGRLNLQYAGVAYDPARNLLLFGISTWGSWSSLTDVAFNVLIDSTGGGFDHVLFNSNPGTMAGSLFGTAGATAQDSYLTGVFNLKTNGVGTQQFVNGSSAASIDSRVLDNNVIILAATPQSLGLKGTTFRWAVQTCSGSDPLCFGGSFDSAPGPFSWNLAAASQGLNFGGARLLGDLPGASVPVTWNLANLTTNGSLGALFLHHHNAAGTTAQVVPVQGTQSADLAVTKGMAPSNPTLGQNATFTLTVSNAGPNAATGVTVSDPLPSGLTYVSDDGGGAYSTGTGLWTVGSLAVGGSATLHIVATVGSTGPIDNVARIASSSLLDPNPANNQSKVTVAAPRSADVALTMGVSSPTVLVGQPVTFNFSLQNKGGDSAYSVNLHEAFAGFPTLAPSGSTASTGVFNPATGMWTLSSMAKGGTATLGVTINAPNMAGTLTNNGTAGSSTADPNNANNSASASTKVLSPSVVTATKSVSGNLVPGGQATYTVVLTNTGSFTQQDNPGDELVDVLPPSLLLKSAGATTGTASANPATNTVTWNGSIPAGGTVTITIQATIAGDAGGQRISNQATVHYDINGDGGNAGQALSNDPKAGAGSNPTVFAVPGVAQIPTLSEVGLAMLMAGLAGAALLLLRRRRGEVIGE